MYKIKKYNRCSWHKNTESDEERIVNGSYSDNQYYIDDVNIDNSKKITNNRYSNNDDEARKEIPFIEIIEK